jgi:hypothetical protein
VFREAVESTPPEACLVSYWVSSGLQKCSYHSRSGTRPIQKRGEAALVSRIDFGSTRQKQRGDFGVIEDGGSVQS